MEAVVPYLFFNGNAKEAFEFYAKALSGNIEMMSTFGEAHQGADEDKDKIMHAVLKAGGLTLMCSDAPEGKREAGQSGSAVSLSMNFSDEAEMDKVFHALSDGGNVTMPLQDTFWGARFGMATDKFGFHWMFNHDKNL